MGICCKLSDLIDLMKVSQGRLSRVPLLFSSSSPLTLCAVSSSLSLLIVTSFKMRCAAVACLASAKGARTAIVCVPRRIAFPHTRPRP